MPDTGTLKHSTSFYSLTPKQRFKRFEAVERSALRLFNLETINPDWPIQDAALAHMLSKHDRYSTWDAHACFNEDNTWIDLWADEVTDLTKLRIGTFKLPERVLRSAATKLFGPGDHVDRPSQLVLDCIGAALFRGFDGRIPHGRRWRTWDEIRRFVDIQQRQKNRAAAAVAELLGEEA